MVGDSNDNGTYVPGQLTPEDDTRQKVAALLKELAVVEESIKAVDAAAQAANEAFAEREEKLAEEKELFRQKLIGELGLDYADTDLPGARQMLREKVQKVLEDRPAADRDKTVKTSYGSAVITHTITAQIANKKQWEAAELEEGVERMPYDAVKMADVKAIIQAGFVDTLEIAKTSTLLLDKARIQSITGHKLALVNQRETIGVRISFPKK